MQSFTFHQFCSNPSKIPFILEMCSMRRYHSDWFPRWVSRGLVGVGPPSWYLLLPLHSYIWRRRKNHNFANLIGLVCTTCSNSGLHTPLSAQSKERFYLQNTNSQTIEIRAFSSNLKEMNVKRVKEWVFSSLSPSCVSRPHNSEVELTNGGLLELSKICCIFK